MKIKRVYVPDVLHGTTIMLKNGPYSFSLCRNLQEGSIYVDKCIFHAVGLPLYKTVHWKIKDEYLDFYDDNESRCSPP